MTSHKKMSGIELTLGSGGLRFKKKASEFNHCVGRQLKGKGGSRQDRKARFTSAVASCRGGRRTVKRRGREE